MDARELMIGDWARIRYNHFETGEEIVKDFRVGQLAKLGIGDDEPLYAWSEKSNMAKVSKVEPIPLTPEIVEKNGFERGSDNLFSYGRGMYVMMWSKWHYSVGQIFGNMSAFVEFAEIRFIHELQHALRLCGIEKEIEI